MSVIQARFPAAGALQAAHGHPHEHGHDHAHAAGDRHPHAHSHGQDDHAHGDHGHGDHGPAHAVVAAAPGFSLLRLSAGQRLAGVAVALAGLWLATWWALT